MTKTLTEQWREGTLPAGHYYCKLYYNGFKPRIQECVKSRYDSKSCIPMSCGCEAEEVLASVPSYDEYKQLVSNSDKLDKIMSDSATNQGDCQQIVEDNLRREISQLEKQLEIAINALKQYSKGDNWLDAGCRGQVFLPTKRGYSIADKALDEMEP